MILAKISVSGTRVTLKCCDKIPAGITGAQIAIEYTDPIWNDMRKTIVFDGCIKESVKTDAHIVTIPRDVVSRPGAKLSVGIYGENAASGLAVPTLWGNLGHVQPSALPDGVPEVTPGIPDTGEPYEGAYTVIPTEEDQILATAGKYMERNVTVCGISSEYGHVTYDGNKTVTII